MTITAYEPVIIRDSTISVMTISGLSPQILHPGDRLFTGIDGNLQKITRTTKNRRVVAIVLEEAFPTRRGRTRRVLVCMLPSPNPDLNLYIPN